MEGTWEDFEALAPLEHVHMGSVTSRHRLLGTADVVQRDSYLVKWEDARIFLFGNV